MWLLKNDMNKLKIYMSQIRNGKYVVDSLYY